MFGIPIAALVVVLLHTTTGQKPPPGGYYTTRYDHLDVEHILNQKRLVHYYASCLLEKGPCTPQGIEFKRILPEALRTNCLRCTEKQRFVTIKSIKRLKKEYPDVWRLLSERWDPTGEYFRKLEEGSNQPPQSQTVSQRPNIQNNPSVTPRTTTIVITKNEALPTPKPQVLRPTSTTAKKPPSFSNAPGFTSGSSTSPPVIRSRFNDNDKPPAPNPPVLRPTSTIANKPLSFSNAPGLSSSASTVSPVIRSRFNDDDNMFNEIPNRSSSSTTVRSTTPPPKTTTRMRTSFVPSILNTILTSTTTRILKTEWSSTTNRIFLQESPITTKRIIYNYDFGVTLRPFINKLNPSNGIGMVIQGVNNIIQPITNIAGRVLTAGTDLAGMVLNALGVRKDMQTIQYSY